MQVCLRRINNDDPDDSFMSAHESSLPSHDSFMSAHESSLPSSTVHMNHCCDHRLPSSRAAKRHRASARAVPQICSCAAGRRRRGDRALSTKHCAVSRHTLRWAASSHPGLRARVPPSVTRLLHRQRTATALEYQYPRSGDGSVSSATVKKARVYRCDSANIGSVSRGAGVNGVSRPEIARNDRVTFQQAARRLHRGRLLPGDRSSPRGSRLFTAAGRCRAAPTGEQGSPRVAVCFVGVELGHVA
jgi:hypothetical protein